MKPIVRIVILCLSVICVAMAPPSVNRKVTELVYGNEKLKAIYELDSENEWQLNIQRPKGDLLKFQDDDEGRPHMSVMNGVIKDHDAIEVVKVSGRSKPLLFTLWDRGSRSSVLHVFDLDRASEGAILKPIYSTGSDGAVVYSKVSDGSIIIETIASDATQFRTERQKCLWTSRFECKK